MEVLADPKDALNLIKALRKDEKMAELNLNFSSQARASRIVRSVRPVSTPSLPSPCYNGPKCDSKIPPCD